MNPSGLLSSAYVVRKDPTKGEFTLPGYYDDYYKKKVCGCCNRRHDEAESEELKTMDCINTARIADSGNSKNTINAGSKSLKKSDSSVKYETEQEWEIDF